MPHDSVLYETLAFPYAANPFTLKAKRTFRFCIPDEWFRHPDGHRRRGRNTETNDASTLEDKADSEGEGTAKAIQHPAEAPTKGAIEKDSVPQNTLSSIFTGFLRPMTPDGTGVSSSKRKTVSEPVLLEQRTGSSIQSSKDLDVDSDAFEAMLVRIIAFLVGGQLTS